MKEYKLRAWPDLPAAYRQVGYRRLLSDLSQHHITEGELAKRSELSRSAIKSFLDHLRQQDLLDIRAAQRHPRAGWNLPGLSRIRHWLRGSGA